MTSTSKEARARADARRNRRNFTDVLKDHGVVGKGYMLCTDGTYVELFGRPAYQLRAVMGLPANANLRDHLEGVDLGAVVLVEALAAKRIEVSLALGSDACIEVTVEAARLVASMIGDDLSRAA